MKDEDRKLWTDRINDYRSSGLTAVNVNIQKQFHYTGKGRNL